MDAALMSASFRNTNRWVYEERLKEQRAEQRARNRDGRDDGFDEHDRDREGYDRDGFDIHGFSRMALPRSAYCFEGYDNRGLDPWGKPDPLGRTEEQRALDNRLREYEIDAGLYDD